MYKLKLFTTTFILYEFLPLLKCLHILAQCPDDVNPAGWLNLEQFHDPELRRLAQLLPGVLLQDKAPGTVKTYITAYKSWKRWALAHDIAPIPAAGTPLALYIVSLIQQERSVSCVNSAIYGLDWVHTKNGHKKPSEYPVVTQTLEAARRILAKPKSRKTPLSSAVVKAIIHRLESGTLGEQQLAALIALGFYGFLRWDDLKQVTPANIAFAPTHLAVHLPKRKNDQFREGSQVLIARSEEQPCPVAVVEKFLTSGRHEPNSILWRRIQNTKHGDQLRKEPMSYSRA